MFGYYINYCQQEKIMNPTIQKIKSESIQETKTDLDGYQVLMRLNEITGQGWQFDLNHRQYAVRLPEKSSLGNKICFRLLGAGCTANEETNITTLDKKLKSLQLPSNLKHSVTRLTREEYQVQSLRTDLDKLTLGMY